MYPTQLHSYLLWRSTVPPEPQQLASRRYTAAVSLIPATMVGVFVFGWWAAWVVFLSGLTAFITDLLTHRFIYKDSSGTRDGTWILTGLLLGLMMPPSVPWIFPVLGSAAAVFLGKHFLSVDGMPLLQPAIIGLVLLNLLGLFSVPFVGTNPMLPKKNSEPAWPVLVRNIEPSSEVRTSPNAVGKLVMDFLGGDVRRSTTHQQYRDAVFEGNIPVIPPEESGRNKSVKAEAVHGPRPLDVVKANPSKPIGRGQKRDPNAPSRVEPYDWVDLVFGYVPATIGGSSALALLFGVLLLLFAGAVAPGVPLFALLTMFAFLHFISWITGGSAVISSNIPIHLLTGSTILGIFYFAADPAIAPRSAMGKIYAGVALGVIEVLLRTITPLTEAIFISVPLVQGLSFVIDQYLAPPAETTHTMPAPTFTTSSLGRL